MYAYTRRMSVSAGEARETRAYRVYLKYLENLQDRAPHTKTREKIRISTCLQIVFAVQHNNLLT
jgi:hypothetical protein